MPPDARLCTRYRLLNCPLDSKPDTPRLPKHIRHGVSIAYRLSNMWQPNLKSILLDFQLLRMQRFDPGQRTQSIPSMERQHRVGISRLFRRDVPIWICFPVETAMEGD